MALTTKQRRFVQEYLVDGNAKRSAEAAGYSQKSAYSIGQRMLSIPAVAAEIQAAEEARAKRNQVDADWVLMRLKLLADFDIRRLYEADGVTLRPPGALDDETAFAVVGIDSTETRNANGGLDHTTKYKMSDKRGGAGRLRTSLGAF